MCWQPDLVGVERPETWLVEPQAVARLGELDGCCHLWKHLGTKLKLSERSYGKVREQLGKILKYYMTDFGKLGEWWM